MTGVSYGPNQPPHGPDPQPPGAPAAPRRESAELGKGLFGVLLDRSFDELVTVRLLRLLYTFAFVCITGFNAVLFLFGWSLAVGHFWPALGWVIVAGVPALWLAELVAARITIEYLIVQHKISHDLVVVREAVKDMRDAGAAP